MSEKVIKVFFDQSGLPYKDRELSVHYPLVGSGFLGASNTTKIRFYYKNIGQLGDTYLAISKIPNGKQGSHLLNIKSQDEDGNYVEMSLSEWYFQAKGDVYISLKVYWGGVEISDEKDPETGFVVISGEQVKFVTGAIKMSVNYAPIGDVPDYRDEFTSYETILELVREKLDINESIYATSDISLLDMSLFEENQIFFDYTRKKFYKKFNSTYEMILDIYDKDTLDTKFSEKVDKLTTSGQYVYSHLGSTQSELPVSTLATGDTIAKRENDGRLKVATPTSNGDATTKEYVDSGLDLKADKSTTYTKTETDTLLGAKADKSDTYTKTQVDDAIASAVSSAYKYKGSVASYSDLPSSGNQVGDVYNVEDTGDNYAWTGTAWDKLAGTVDLSDYVTDSELSTALSTKQNTINSLNKLDSDLVDDTNQTNKFVTTSEKSTWNAKQDALVSGTSIKTIAGQSVLGSGAIDLSEYAKVDGNYPTLTSGQALSIYSDREISDADQACPPITFGTAGGSAEIQTGYNKFEELRGNSIVWNQLFRTVNMVNPVTTNYGITYQRNATTGVCTFSGTSTSESNNQISLIAYNVQTDIISSHKFLLKWNLIGIKPAISEASTNLLYGNNEGDIGTDVVFNGTVRTNTYAQIFIKAGAIVNFSIQPQIIDLTALLGETKANELYAMEQANAGSGILAFNRDYPLPYYEYNAGQLLSSKSSALESIGMNQYQALNTYIEVIAGEKYHISGISAGGYIEEYDGAKNLIKTSEEITSTTIVELDANTHFVKVQATTYTDIMLRLYCDTNNVPYQPYEKQTVTLPDIELRSVGIVYDVIYSSGNGKRRVWLVKLTDLSWNYAAGSGTFANTFRGTLPTGKNGKYPSAYGKKANLICNAYKTVSLEGNEYQGGTDKTICLRENTTIQIQDSQYNGDLQAFLNANVNTYIQYELETEEDITSDPFTELVKVDNYGTLKFVSSQAIQVPQAYFIRYTVSLTEWLDSAYAYTDGTPDKLALKSYVDTAISQIPTGDFGFPIITAPSSTTLTADEVETISKGAVILGSSSNKFLNYEKIVFFPLGEASFGENGGFALCVNGFVPELRSYRINSQNVISINDVTTKRIRLASITQLNGKNIPDYPSSTGTFVLKCVDGTLTWVAE